MKVLIVSGCLFVAVVVILAICGVLKRENVKLAYYSRVPLLAALVLLLIGPISIYSPLKHLMGNAFLAYGFWQLTLTSAISFLAAFLFASIYRNIEYNGRERFLGIPLVLGASEVERASHVLSNKGSPIETSNEGATLALAGDASKPSTWVEFVRQIFLEQPTAPNCWGRLKNVWHVTFAVAIGLSPPLCVLWHSAGQEAWTARGPAGYAAIGLGFVLACVFLLLATILTDRVAPTKLQIPGMYGIDLTGLLGKAKPGKISIWIGKKVPLGPGYASEDPDHPKSHLIHPGHVQLTFATVTMAIFYGIIYWWSLYVGPVSKSGNTLPTVAYVVFVIGFVTSIIAFLTFLLDYYHAPSTLVSGAFLILIYSLPTHVPASFQAVPSTADPAPLPTLSEILSTRIERAKKKWPITTETGKPGRRESVLIVVTAPGGGIHAAAWTARVLTGLHKLYGQPFDDSLGIISGISGGGMGAWVYVDALSRESEEAIAGVNTIAQSSSLDAVAWGLAFPDLIRSVNPFPWSPDDRGRVLEQTWEARLENWKPEAARERCTTLGQLALRASEGTIPLIAWTTTDVVTGNRVVLAPVADGVGAPETTINLYKELRQLGKDHSFDLQAATATRLAATFPYVTPIVGLEHSVTGTGTSDSPELKASAKKLSQLRCIDGGYFDNEGLITAVNCIAKFLTDLEQGSGDPRPIDRIILLRIEPSPPDPSDANASTLEDSGIDLVMSALGPLLALANVRSASQSERGNLEAQLLSRASENAADLAKATTTEIQKHLNDLGLSETDVKTMLWTTDWKHQVFGEADLEKSKKLLSAALKMAHSNNKPDAKPQEHPFLSPSISETAVQALDWWKSKSITAEHDIEDLSKQLVEFTNLPWDKQSEAMKQNVYPILDDLRGRTRANSVRQIVIEQVTVPFKIHDKTTPPPLSWALSPKEARNYDAAWTNLLKMRDPANLDSTANPMRSLDRVFVGTLQQPVPQTPQ